MDWRLNGRNAEQNYKIIIDKGAVRTGRGWGWGCGAAGGGVGTQYLFCLPRRGCSTGIPLKSFQNGRGSVVCVIS